MPSNESDTLHALNYVKHIHTASPSKVIRTVRLVGESVNLVMEEWFGAAYAILELTDPILLMKEQRQAVEAEN